MTARINKIDTADCFHVLCVADLRTEQKDEVKIPVSVDISPLSPGCVIVYYRAEEEYSKAEGETPSSGRIVLLFTISRAGYGKASNQDRFLWLEKGETLFNLERLPRIAEILLGISDYYGKRRDVVEKSLEILKLTQDPETLDALFSLRPEVLHILLADKACPVTKEQLASLSLKDRNGLISDAVISVQIADILVALSQSGADFEHPRRRDVRQILSLALIHGASYRTVNDFIVGYERE